MQFGNQFGLSLYDAKKAWKNPKKDRTPVSTQNLTVVAKDAILKADTRQRLDKCAESLEVRYTNGQPRVRYELHKVLAWEEANGITPIEPF